MLHLEHPVLPNKLLTKITHLTCAIHACTQTYTLVTYTVKDKLWFLFLPMSFHRNSNISSYWEGREAATKKLTCSASAMMASAPSTGLDWAPASRSSLTWIIIKACQLVSNQSVSGWRQSVFYHTAGTSFWKQTISPPQPKRPRGFTLPLE